MIGADAGPQNVLAIDPGLVDVPAGYRQPRDQDVFNQFIRDVGQIAPILVRPHPDLVDRFELVFGRRRLDAARTLGRPVYAIVRTLTDVEAVIMKGQENAVRGSLSFIEQAMLAWELERGGYQRDVMMMAIAVDKTGLSRRVAIAYSLPESIVDAIGPAPKSDHRAWTKLVELLRDTGAIARAHAMLATLSKIDDSDLRLRKLVKALKEPSHAGGRPGR